MQCRDTDETIQSRNLDNVTESRGNFRLQERVVRFAPYDQSTNIYTFNSGNLISEKYQNYRRRDSLVEALYGSQHFNITTSGSYKIDDDTCPGIIRGNGRSDAAIKAK